MFQFTPLREGRRQLAICAAENVVFQFTPLREGRLGKLLTPARQSVSIHAPA